MLFEELFNSKTPPKKDDLTDEDITRLFIKYKGLLKKQERDEAFWIATNENIKRAYSKLDELVEKRTIELKTVNEQLQQELTERKKAEKRVKESEEQIRLERDNLKNILNSMKDGVYIVNQQYDIEFVNLILIEEFGPFEKKKCFKYFHDREEVCPWCKNQEVFTGKTVRWEWFSFKRQKTYDLVDTLLKNPNGSMSKLEIFRDITERKKVEEALKESEIFNRLLVDTLPIGLALCHMDGSLIDVNPAYAKILGRSIEETLKLTYWDITPKKYNKQELAQLESMEKTGHYGPYEKEYIHRNGHLVPVRLSGLVIEKESEQFIWSSVEDITEHMEAEDALRISEERFRSLVETTSDWIWEVDQNGVYTYSSPKVKDILGYERDEIIGKTPFDLMPSQEAERVGQIFQKIIDIQEPFNALENINIHKDGHNVVLETSGVPIFDFNRNFLGYRGIDRDITVRKAAEENLRNLMEDLKRSNAELEQFAYVASHDLQEPLRMIASFTQLLEQRYKDKIDEDANDFINFIMEGASRMQGLINDLLAFSRVGTGGKPFKATDINEIIRDVKDNLKKLMEESNATITNDPLPAIIADKAQLTQLFQNLISNAIKFHRKGIPPNVHITGEVKKNKWIFSVQDNGIGIEKENFNRIFVIFQRLHKRNEYSGTGIGLAICKKIIQRHRGKIWVDSDPNKGSTFYFSIPRRKIVEDEF
ncbi:MAG: PAS domain S-box protein [Candidatus Lokiarchaeia archaeon]